MHSLLQMHTQVFPIFSADETLGFQYRRLGLNKISVTRRPNQCSETPGLAPRSTESSVPSNHWPQNETLKLVLRCVSRGVSKHQFRATRHKHECLTVDSRVFHVASGSDVETPE